MPRGDRTGPMGMGPMTGRAAGYCAGYGVPGFANPVPGWGFGLGLGWGRGFRGGGRGWRHMYYATGLPGWMRFGGYAAPYGFPIPYPQPDPDREKQALKNQAAALQSQLDLIKKRLGELETEPPSEGSQS
ncbi:MAG TPA: DUF5320 domain-containing protein [bacterium]|nr:DUF5320 domain-containing protein [bacterium]HOL96695.1 DUF5320 domain-containing protein [bacterium]HPP01663.1 DUF5320 domain-containing protein [bacterium]HXK93049.1 DUF5320 domain-containing protein [bacterium]